MKETKQIELVKFQGDDLPAYRETVEGKEIVRVNVRAVCKALGINSNHQLTRIREDPILAEGSSRSAKQTPSGVQESVFLDVEDHVEHIIEIYGDRIRIIGLSREGIWLPLLEFHVTPEIVNVFRVPLLLKVTCSEVAEGHTCRLS